MKWKKTLTTEEIAMIATDLDRYKSLSHVEKNFESPLPPFKPSELDNPDYSTSTLTEYQETLFERYEKAKDIKDALEREVYIVDPHNTDMDDEALSNTNLVISLRGENEEGWIIPHRCLITRESAALWFYDIDIDMAKKLHPHIETLAIKKDAEKQANKQAWSPERNTQSELRTSEQTLLESIGIISLILSNEGPLYKNGNSANAKQIAEAVRAKASELNIDIEKISNLERDISKGLKKIQDKKSIG